jgi:Txe/YoeB family toxin of toxin-antitoxin system
LLDVLAIDPLQNPPPYEKLVGDLKGTYSRRINIQHGLLYEIFRKEKTVRVLRMWTHYE